MIFRRVVARVTFGAQRTWRRALSYPAHEVVGLPALSPTMSSGVIANWKVSEGGSYAAGDVICEVETDKATVDFEAQDDGIVAKILAQAGNEVSCFFCFVCWIHQILCLLKLFFLHFLFIGTGWITNHGNCRG